MWSVLIVNTKDKQKRGIVLDQDKKQLIAIISSYLPAARIVLFGSRARGDNTPESDIDVAIDNQHPIAVGTLYAIKEAIEESHIPFSVDVVDIHAVSASFKAQIMKEGIIWKF